jgi:hypothetical protein
MPDLRPSASAPRRSCRPLSYWLLLVLCALVGVPAATQAPAAAAGCAPGSGVTVVVDFASLGGGVRTGCDPSGAGDPASRVVPRAGFPLTYVSTEPFVCRISGLPDASTENCADTPPADAYWALFWSDGKKSSWTYASSGVTSLDVPEGGSIGFRFQSSGSRTSPGAPPNPAAPPKPEPTKSSKPTPQPTKAPATPSQSATPTASASSGATPSGRPSAAQMAQRAERRADERAEDRTGKRKDRQADAKAERRAERETDDEVNGSEQVTADGVAQEETPLAPTSATDDGGSGLTWVAGGAVLLLAAAAGVLARRRRG